jgi:quaternary ammonium compound-resistance protein SugE
MAWIYLLIAGGLEIAWAVGLKYSDGFTKFWASTLTLVGMAASGVFLALAVQKIPLGTAYATWTGIGAVGTAILGMVLFGESAALARFGFIGLILIGIAGLKATSGH